MDYQEILKNISNQTRIIDIQQSQVQSIIKGLRLSVLDNYNFTKPLIPSYTVNLVNTVNMQVAPTLSAVRQAISQLNCPSLVSLLKDTNSFSTKLSGIYDICHEIFHNTIFESGTGKVNEETCEKIIVDSAIATNNLAQYENNSPIKKRNILKQFFRKLLKLVGPMFLSILLAIVGPYWQDIYNEKIKPNIYYNELATLQKENQDCELRLVTKATNLYAGKRMRKIIASVEKYEIVEVLNDCGKIIKVKLYYGEEIGWIYKKYTKKSK